MRLAEGMAAADTAQALGAPAALPAPDWTFADALPLLFALWLAGAVVVLVRAAAAHRRFTAAVLAEGADLEPLGTVRLVMSAAVDGPVAFRSEEHTSELQSIMRISYAVFCLKKKT